MNNLTKKYFTIASVFLLLSISIYLIFFPPIHIYNSLDDKNSSSLSVNIPTDQQFQNENGELIQLKDIINKPVILTTGFTRCPYTCPLTMLFLNKLKQHFNEDITAVFLTVDPSFDTPEVLHSFLSQQPNSITGLRIEDPNQLNHFIQKIGQMTYSKTDQKFADELDPHHKSFVVLLGLNQKPQLFLVQNYDEIKSQIEDMLTTQGQE